MIRREFVKGCCALTAAMLGSKFNLLAFNEDVPDKNNIVVNIFLRGGCDALNLVAPIADKFYQDARSEGLKIKDSGSNKGIEIANGLARQVFALHGEAQGLADLYKSKQLAIVHACGVPNGSRSHFEAQDMIDLGVATRTTQTNGWLARYVDALANGSALIPAAHLGRVLPLSYLGSNKALAISSLGDFNLKGDARLSGLLRQTYSQEKNHLGDVARATLDNLKTIRQKLGDNKKGEYNTNTEYPKDNPLAESLRSLAQMIKLDVGLNAASIDFGGWDTHEGQAWAFPRLVEKLSTAIAAFYNDMSAYHQKLTIVVMSEFGRRLKSNKSEGTDHGHGGIAFVLGGKVNGGKMYGEWVGLETDMLDHRVDLQVTTDYRSILTDIIRSQLDAQALAAIFPNFQQSKNLGLMR
jgi:uncharacterized protein (DUF1501 family)